MYTQGLRCDGDTANRKTDAVSITVPGSFTVTGSFTIAGSFTVTGSCSSAVAVTVIDGVTFAGAGTRSRTGTNEIIFKEIPAHDSQSEVSCCQGK